MSYSDPNFNKRAGAHKPTQDELLARRTQIYMQKRETFALNALNKLLETRPVKKATDTKGIDNLVLTAVNIADKLLVTLYKSEDENPETDGSKED